MSKYAVKIGEIYIVSEKPITEMGRKMVAEDLALGYAADLLQADVIEIRVTLPQP